MILNLFDPKIPDVQWLIMNNLDERSLLQCRLVCKVLQRTIDEHFKFHGKLSDRKLRRRSRPLAFDAFCKFQEYEEVKDRLIIKKLVVGKLIHSLKNLPLHIPWDSVEEIEFNSAVISQNFHTLLKACRLVQTIRVNYLAIGGQKRKSFKSLRKLFQKPQGDQEQSLHLDTNYFLPYLKSIHIDRGLDTNEFIENKNRNKYKHFNADLYFKTMACLIDELEKEVQGSILEMLRIQIEKKIADDPNTGFFFTKPSFVNRFPMSNVILNKFLMKLRT